MEKWEARRRSRTQHPTTRSGRRKRRRETKGDAEERKKKYNTVDKNKEKESEGTLPEDGRNIRQEGVQFKKEGRRGDQKR
jgi:hypothetical protein